MMKHSAFRTKLSWSLTAVIGVLLLQPSVLLMQAAAFTPNAPINRPTRSLARPMSDVPQEKDDRKGDGDNKDGLFSTYLRPPPPPEDTFVMTGDLLSLCVYGITDHFFCQVVSRMMVQETLADPLHHLSRAASASSGGAHVLQSPVWLDMNAHYADRVLEANLQNQLVTQYSPLLEPMGTATCLLIAAWLVAGWFHQAFLFRNTLECSTERALIVTAKTWLTTCGILFSMVLLSQKACGCDHFYLVQRGDLDYIVDSASVLVLWRFLASYLMGTGGNDD